MLGKLVFHRIMCMSKIKACPHLERDDGWMLICCESWESLLISFVDH